MYLIKRTLTPNNASISSFVKSSAALWFVRPALQTTPWIAPASSTILSMAAVMLASSVTFAEMEKRRPGNCLDAAANSSPGSARSIE